MKHGLHKKQIRLPGGDDLLVIARVQNTDRAFGGQAICCEVVRDQGHFQLPKLPCRLAVFADGWVRVDARAQSPDCTTDHELAPAGKACTTKSAQLRRCVASSRAKAPSCANTSGPA